MKLSAQPNGAQTRLTWTGVDEVKYPGAAVSIYAVNGDSAQYVGYASSSAAYFDVTPTNAQTRYFAVYATSGYSNFVSATDTMPVAPNNLEASIQVQSPDTATINLIWNNNSNNEEEFIIEKSEYGGSVWEEIGSVDSDVSIFKLPIERDDLEDFSLRVRAKKGDQVSAASNQYARPWPINGVVTNETSTLVRVWNDKQKWHDVLGGSTTPLFSRDEDYIYIDGKYYKIGAVHVYVKYTGGPNGERSVYHQVNNPVTGHGWKELAPVGPGEYVPPGTP